MGKVINGYIVPHPPIIVPGVGKGREGEAVKTVEAMKRVAKDVAQDKPATIILSSPHAPFLQDYAYVEDAPVLSGDLKDFGYYDEGFQYENNLILGQLIVEKAKDRGIQAGSLTPAQKRRFRVSPYLDHGTVVPLYFIAKELKDFKLVVISTPYMPMEQNYELGKAIAEAVKESSENVVYIASGDLSHRLAKDGPMGYSVKGRAYDDFLISSLEKGDAKALLEIDDQVVEEAGECGTRSFVMMLGALEGILERTEIYSYEGPFGVGYAVGKAHCISAEKDSFSGGDSSRGTVDESIHVKLAKAALEAFVRQGKTLSPPDWVPMELKKERAGVFVSLKKGGNLRGCIGTIGSVRVNIAEEIIFNAISAGTKDPRFETVEEWELDHLVYSVDVLARPEKINSLAELDVKKYGVIVTAGFRRGLLLPNLEGIDSPAQQIEIALQKAGIHPSEDYEMERFEVIRYK